MQYAYDISLRLRCKVEGEDAVATDELAERFAADLRAWIDGGLGSPPFAPWTTVVDHDVQRLDVTPEKVEMWGFWPVTRGSVESYAAFDLAEPADRKSDDD